MAMEIISVSNTRIYNFASHLSVYSSVVRFSTHANPREKTRN